MVTIQEPRGTAHTARSSNRENRRQVSKRSSIIRKETFEINGKSIIGVMTLAAEQGSSST